MDPDFRGGDANAGILSRMRVAPPTALDGATRSREIMMFLVTIIFIVLVALAAYAGYVVGARGRAGNVVPGEPHPPPSAPALAAPAAPLAAALAASASAEQSTELERVDIEKARIIRSRDAEAAVLRQNLADRDARLEGDVVFRRERERLSAELVDARQESARYRALVVDIENNAPPPILSGVGEPDDLKLIVGIGPVLERMLHNLGVTTFRQIARWSERDSAEFDAKLPEFPGRIVRDQWVTQARELHQAKFGELPSDRPPRP
jgi:predicted flap endonuclease-1-like 5' DNA nuclease